MHIRLSLSHLYFEHLFTPIGEVQYVSYAHTPDWSRLSLCNVGCRQACTADAAVGRPHRGTRRRTPRAAAAAAAATALQQTLTQPTDLWPDLHTVGHSGCPDTKTLHPLLYTLIPEQLYSHKQALGTAAATSTTAVLQLHWLWLQLSPLL